MDSPFSHERWRPAPDVVARQIREEVLLVPVRRRSEALDEFFSLNPTAAEIWTQIGSGHTADEIAAHLTARYDVSAETAAADVARTLHELVAIGALVEKDSN